MKKSFKIMDLHGNDRRVTCKRRGKPSNGAAVEFWTRASAGFGHG
jgi:hypothetical protein